MNKAILINPNQQIDHCSISIDERIENARIRVKTAYDQMQAATLPFLKSIYRGVWNTRRQALLNAIMQKEKIAA